MTKAKTQETVAAKRETRVEFVDGGVNFKLPGGNVVGLRFDALPKSTMDHAFQYGLRRLYQDGLAGAIKDGADADEAAQGLIDRFASGDFSRSRSAQGMSLASVAKEMAAAAIRAKHGKAGTPEQIKSVALQLLDLRAAQVQAEFDRRKAASEDLDGIEI